MPDPRPRYEHRQGGGFTRLTFVLAILALPVLSLDPKAGPALDRRAFLLIDLRGVRRTDGPHRRRRAHVAVWPPRLPARSRELADIASATITRTTFWEGWGIRLTRRGWLYNVSGNDAVLIARHNGKSFLLGTDEPRKLKVALDAVLAPAHLATLTSDRGEPGQEGLPVAHRSTTVEPNWNALPPPTCARSMRRSSSCCAKRSSVAACVQRTLAKRRTAR